MKLLHSTKSSKIPNEIQIDTEAALASTALIIRTVKQKGEIRHIGLVWKLPAATTGEKSRHEGHVYELLIEPEWLDKLEGLLHRARTLFAVNEIPEGKRVVEEGVDVKEEDDEVDE